MKTLTELKREKDEVKTKWNEYRKQLNGALSVQQQTKMREFKGKLNDIDDEIFEKKHKIKPYVMDEGKKVYIWDEKGSYNPEWFGRFHLPIFSGRDWSCTGEWKGLCQGKLGSSKREDCFVSDKIRLSTDLNVEWDEGPLKKYMKKPYIEKLFGVKIPKKDLVDFSLVAGLYHYSASGTYGSGFNSIIDVSEYINRYEAKLLKKHGEEKLNALKFPLLFSD